MNEKTNKKKVRFNVIDVLIIFLVVALIATVVYRVYTGVNEGTASSQGKYVITFESDSEYDSIVDYLKKGTAVYFADSGKLLGQMYAPNSKTPAVSVISEQDGKSGLDYSLVAIRGYILMSGETVKVSGAGYYSIGGTNVTVGSTINVYTNEAEFTLVVKSIDTK